LPPARSGSVARIRVLFLTCHLPYPPFSGGRRREHELLARLVEEVEVDVCAVTKTLDEDREAAGGVPWRHAGIHLFEAERRDHAAPQVARHGSDAARAWIARGRWDAIHVEGFYLWQHLPPRRPPALLCEQNVEYQLWAQRGLQAASRATRTAERAAWAQADALAAVTREDAASIAAAARRRVRVVPNGADHDSRLGATRSVSIRDSNAIAFVANFAYEPNVDGALWLAREVLPLVRERVPQARLLLVGNAPPPAVRALAGPAVDVTGRVPAVEPYLDAAAVVACPLRVGGGVKVKLLEALARGCAVVTTPIGTQGIPTAERATRVAANAEPFAAALCDVLADPLERARLREAARRCAARLPTWDGAAAELAATWHELARGAARAA
jgi:polysaccharide biosynthesis protein PslH